MLVCFWPPSEGNKEEVGFTAPPFFVDPKDNFGTDLLNLGRLISHLDKNPCVHEQMYAPLYNKFKNTIPTTTSLIFVRVDIISAGSSCTKVRLPSATIAIKFKINITYSIYSCKYFIAKNF